MSTLPPSPSSSSNRREARRLAMCAQYAREFTGYTVAETLPLLIGMKPDASAWPEFARHLCYAVEQYVDPIAEELGSVLEHWKLDRVAPIERAILKLGAAEISYFPDIPPRVTINEYIELAKAYANDNAPAFINGVLDRLSHKVGKKDFQANRKPTAPRMYSASGNRVPSPAPPPQSQPEVKPAQPPSAPEAPPSPPPAPRFEVSHIRSRWAQEIYEVLREFGGSAELDDLYHAIERRGRVPLTAEWQFTVQGILDRHNADSMNFEGNPGDPYENLFHRVDKRRWAIRTQ